MFFYFFWLTGGLVLAAIVILIVFLVLSKNEGMGDVVYLYERVIEVPGDKLFEAIENGLRKFGILAFKAGDSLVVSDFVSWEMSNVSHGDKSYLRIRAGVKTWYFVLTVVFLVFFLVIGIVLGILAFWKFMNVRDRLKWILAEETGNMYIVNML